ncbi:hypothetical protein QRB36_17565 [Mycobacterium marseillense]|uniref:hypothetical protein n=1 Tax=Mycobacterium marseillense TaxID=701042 RepID=UPI00259254EF|nr:hypothetical protein [Mycobacterium marseillense]MDM3975978.1 hypothetical protein [Mycobacterium marseillense]
MAKPKVWVSTTAQNVALGAGGPGSHWEEVGTIDTVQERDLWKNVQVHLGLRASAPHLTGFYLHGMANSPWVVDSRDRKDQGPFWLAIDPFGDGTRYLVTAAQASLETLARHPTESHPGLIEQAVTLGIRVKEHEHRVFDAVGP